MLMFGTPQQLTDGPQADLRANWTPDGTRIVFERVEGEQRRLWTIQPDGQGLSECPLDDPPDSQTTGRPAFLAPDDFVFVSDRTGRPALYRSQAGHVTALYTAETACHGPALGHTSGWPLLFFQQEGQHEFHIHQLSEAGQATQLTRTSSTEDQPWPLPDGRSFVYHAQVEGRHLVYRQVMAPGAPPERLSEGDEGTAYVTPFPSPDGQWIALTSKQSGEEQIWIMRVDGTARQQVTFGPPHSFPAWRPDGHAIVCTQGQPTAEHPTGHLILVPLRR